MNYKNEFAIQQLRTKNVIKGVESLAAFIGAVITNMLVPQLLIKYVYDPSTLIAPPPVFEYLPLVTYGLALLFFIYAMVGNFSREKKASILEKELTLHSDCCSDDEVSDEELKELEKIVDEALKPKKKTKSRATKKSTKTTKKKKTTKK